MNGLLTTITGMVLGEKTIALISLITRSIYFINSVIQMVYNIANSNNNENKKNENNQAR